MTRRDTMSQLEDAAAAAAAAVEEVKPLLRGVLHAWAFWAALVAAVVLVVIAPHADARWAAAIYGAGLCALFGVSGTYHRWRWNPRWKPVLRRLDHSTIFLFVAASGTPVAWLALSDPLRTVVLLCLWIGAAAGIVLTVAWRNAPRVADAIAYLVVGWAAVIGFPQLAGKLPLTPMVLLIAGGLLYTVGAVVYARRRPDPWPRVFGFHEVFHVLVILAAVAHFAAIAGWIVPAG